MNRKEVHHIENDKNTKISITNGFFLILPSQIYKRLRNEEGIILIRIGFCRYH